MIQSASGAARAIFDSSALAPEDRFDAWRQVLGYAYEVNGAPEGFSAKLDAIRIDNIVISRLDTSAFALARGDRQVRDGLEHFVLYMNPEGFYFECDNGLRRHAAPGAVTINDTSRTFVRSVAAEAGSIAVSIARSEIEAVMPDPSLAHGRIVDPKRAELLVEHMRSLLSFAAATPAGTGRGIGRATALILAASLRTDADSRLRTAAQPVLDTALKGRARRYINENLWRSDLRPEQVARALSVSRSTLFRLFEPSGGVERHIRQRRLANARARLQDQDTPTRISQIAFDVGFSSPAHFSRAFRDAYGVGPRDFRAAAATDHETELSAFSEMIKSLS